MARVTHFSNAMKNMPTALKQEAVWLGGGLLASFVIGAAISLPVALPVVFLFGFTCWLMLRMARIVAWLESGAKAQSAPQSAGMTDAMVQQVHREKKYSSKLNKRYRDALAQFNNLASEMPDATLVLDELKQIRWANSAALRLLNVDPERDRGQRIDNLIRAPEFREFLNSADSQSEIELDGLNSNDRTLAIRCVPSGHKMTVLIARDVTQRVRVREMRKAFVGDVSHELRTPLTVIQGYLEMLNEMEHGDPSVANALKDVATQSDRMRHIVDHLLELSKLEGNPLGENEGENINMSNMLRSMLVVIERTEKEHVFVADIDESLTLLGSENEIYSACLNLLSNAAKYTHAGSTITVAWYRNENGSPVYSVSDDGPGIEAHHLPRLSERFYRVDKGRSRESGGTGLGLAIVKHSAQRHGGHLDITSTPGTGSVFSIEFPASRAGKPPKKRQFA